MSLTVPDEFLRSAGMNKNELLLEIAILLFQRERLTLAQASRMARVTQVELQKALAARGIPIHYGVDELREDLESLGKAGLL